MSWTEEKVSKLKELWGKGKTASQIAEVIGGISRNAVIGKAHRLNLSAKIPPTKVAVIVGIAVTAPSRPRSRAEPLNSKTSQAIPIK